MKFKLVLLTLLSATLSHATTERISVGPAVVEGNGASFVQDITPDGRYVVFTSVASNLVAGDTNGVEDVFLYDRDTETVTRVSLPNSDPEGNGASNEASISDDGRLVCFTSDATNMDAGEMESKTSSFVI